MSFDFTVKEFILGNGTGTPTFQFYRRGFNLNGSSGGGWTDIILHGNTALTLVNAKANGINYVKLFGNAEQRNLPAGYMQYEYLRSSGTQYIDLGYKGKGNTKVEIKFRYHTATSATGSGRVFGSRITSSSDAFAIGSASGIVSAEGTNKVFWCYDGQPYFVDNTAFGLDEWQTVVFSATEHTIDGVTVGDDYTVTEFETPNNLKLFGFDNNGTIGCGYVDIAYCKLWDDDGTLVRDVVPSGDGTTYNMFDKVSGTMLPNAGTGDFVAGSAVVPTPDEPIDIVSNNGAIKYSANMANVNEQTALIGYYISSSGVVTADPNNWMYQDFIPVKPNTAYTLTMSSSVYYVTISEYSTADDSGFVIRKTGVSGDNTTLTITTGSTTNYIRFGTNIDRTGITLDRVLAIDWMLNVGDTMAYQPYVDGGIYTDGTVETVEVTGKNLFDINSVTILGVRYTSTAVGNNIEAVAGSSTNTSSRISIFIPVSFFKENTTYYFNSKSDTSFNLNRCTIGKSTPDSTSDSYYYGTINQKVDNGYSGSFTITDIAPDQEYVSIFYYLGEQDANTKITISDIQIELGSTATTYEPYYNGGTAVAKMLLKVGDYKDEQNVTNGHITRNVGVMVFDGSENWVSAGTGSSLRCHITYDIGLPNTEDLTSPMMCSHYQFGGYISGGGATTQGTFNAFSRRTPGDEAYYLRFSIVGMGISSASGFKQWLKAQYNAGTPVTIVYPLAESTTESVPHQHLSIQAGTNIVEITQASINNLGLEVSYKGTVTP